MTGDIQLTAEQHLYDLGLIHKCDILKIPHHGYKDNTNSDFYITANPEYAINSSSSWMNQIASGGTLNSQRLAYLKAIDSKIFNLGSGAIYAGLHDRSYTVYPNGNEAISYKITSSVVTLNVNQSYTGQISNGTSNYPFKSLQQAIGFANELCETEYIRINIIGTYTESSTTIFVSSLKNKLDIHGASASDVQIHSMSIRYSSVDLENITIFGTNNIPLQYYDANGRISNCIINGNTRSAASISDSRGISVNGSTVLLSSCTISNKRMAIGCYASGVVTTVGGLYGSNNEYLAYGSNGKSVIINGNISYEKLTSNAGGVQIEYVSINGKYAHSSNCPFTVFRDDAGSSTTTVLDLSDDDLYYRRRFMIYYGDGSVYTFVRWGGSISSITKIIDGPYTGVTPMSVSVSGKTISLTYSSIISVVCVI